MASRIYTLIFLICILRIVVSSLLLVATCRCRREIDNFKEENRRLKQDKTSTTQEMGEMRKNSDRLERRIQQLSKLEEECHRLQEENSILSNEANSMREQFESVILEKEELESRTHEALEALEEEKEVRSILEVRLKEDSAHFHTPHPSWAVEGKEVDNEEDSRHIVLSNNRSGPESPPISPSGVGDGGSGSASSHFHSTPYHAVRHQLAPNQQPTSLLNELQDSLQQSQLDDHREELEALKKKVSELEEKEGVLLKEKRVLEDTISAASVRESAQLKENKGARVEFSKGVSERDTLIEDLQQKVVIRDEQISNLRSKLSMTTAEKTSLEIEVDGLNSEMKRIKVVSGVELEKVQKECALEVTKNIDLNGNFCVLEDQLKAQVKTVENLEVILSSSHGEVSAMTEDIRSLQKVVAMLSANGKVSSTSSGSGVPSPKLGESPANGGGDETFKENGQLLEEKEEVEYYKLELKKEKSPIIQVHSETQSLKAIVSLHEQLRLVRAPLESFTKGMLERSLTQPAKFSMSSSPRPFSPETMAGANRKNTLDLEASVSKWKSKYLHKAEENSNLRSIMKARATTYDVAVSSMRSKLDGQARYYQSEVTKLKYQIKVLKKERDEHLSLRNMYSKRCEDYIDEITRSKKLMEKRKQEYDEVMVSLQKTIRRKLELSTELEEYKMEHERTVIIPKQLEASRV